VQFWRLYDIGFLYAKENLPMDGSPLKKEEKNNK
jgi:hypothetical protein